MIRRAEELDLVCCTHEGLHELGIGGLSWRDTSVMAHRLAPSATRHLGSVQGGLDR